MPSKWYTEQPTNRNFLAPAGFKLELELFAGVDFFCQRANVPDISAPFIEAPTRYRPIPLASAGGVKYGDLRLKFIIDEDMKNYLTIHKWIRKNNLADEMDNYETPQYSKGQLLILNSNYATNIVVDYDNLFPIDLTEVVFDVEDENVDYLTADVTFKFSNFRFLNKNNREI